MGRSRAWLAITLAVTALACGDQVSVLHAGGGGAGAGPSGGGGATSSSTSSTGASGGGFTNTTNTTTTTTKVLCPVVLDEATYFLTVEGDGELLVLGSGCAEPHPALSLGGGGECSEGAMVSACGLGNEPELSFNAPGLTTPTTVTGVSFFYRRDQTTYQAYDASATLTTLGEVGDPATGSYSATVVSNQDPADVLSLSGDFVLCRVPDLPPCP